MNQVPTPEHPPSPTPDGLLAWPAVLERWSSRRLAAITALIGMLLALPALWTGFTQDDYFFLMVFKGSPGLEALDRGPLETYSFSKGEETVGPALKERGYMPWWTPADWKINFWRPLASLSNWMDYQLFGETAWPMHLHSLLLYGLLVFTAALLYRRLIGPPFAGGLAALLFAADAGHAIPAAWLSMRNALLALLFGLLVLHAHNRWRRGGAWFPHAPLAMLWLALALLCGEAAVATGAYLFAYALFLDPAARDSSQKPGAGRFARSISALLPYLAVVLVWRMAYAGLGFGTEASGLYIDPAGQPIAFLERLPARFGALMLGLFALPDAALWSLAPGAVGHLLLAVAALFLGAGAWAIAPLLRQRPEARFLLLGALLAVVPACATLPMDRNTMFASFGALGLVALYLGGIRSGEPWATGPGRRMLHRTLAIVLVVAHLVVAPAGLVAGTQLLPMMHRMLTSSNPSVPDDLPASTRIVALNTPTDLLGTSLPVQRAAQERPIPRHWWWLYSGVGRVDVERTGAQTLVLRPAGGFLTSPWADIFRFPVTHPMHAGDRFELDGVEIEVLAATPGGRPTAVSFTFAVPLEHESLYFLQWRPSEYVPFPLPAPGETTRIPGPRLKDLIPIALGR